MIRVDDSALLTLSRHSDPLCFKAIVPRDVSEKSLQPPDQSRPGGDHAGSSSDPELKKQWHFRPVEHQALVRLPGPDLVLHADSFISLTPAHLVQWRESSVLRFTVDAVCAPISFQVVSITHHSSLPELSVAWQEATNTHSTGGSSLCRCWPG